MNVEVRIPDGTKAGNYTGQLILIGTSGGVATANINLTVTYDFFQCLAVYWFDLVLVGVGVFVSFVYSPLVDQSRALQAALTDKTAKLGQPGPEGRIRSWICKSRLYLTLRDRVHATNFWFCIFTGVVAFAYVLTEIPGFGADPTRAAATALIDGFVLHRIVDGTQGNTPKAKA